MSLRRTVRFAPERIATGAYVLHSGLQKWKGSAQQAEGVHGMAKGAYPFLSAMDARTFLRALSVGEITIGSLLLLPFVPNRVAGAALSGFSGALLTMYLRTPSLHHAGSVWPTQQGIAVSKDVWMFGIGTGMLLDAALGEP